MKDASGKEVGKVDLTETPHGVLIKLSLKGFPAGERAFHIHAVGKCEPPFNSAGGHFNPTGRKHGMAAAEGAHAGDMPNLFVPANGELIVEVANPAITLVESKPNSVFDSDGSAIIIHAGPDDYKADPTGNAGDRVACGLIAKK
ncbi:MAG: superoxide dismutase family protein [Reyranella sp.]|uniref:superoxide dismutase family protein n=1 Tax=Reyranella sp. TaxID=1929291 RepID=UPI003D14AE9E